MTLHMLLGCFLDMFSGCLYCISRFDLFHKKANRAFETKLKLKVRSMSFFGGGSLLFL